MDVVFSVRGDRLPAGRERSIPRHVRSVLFIRGGESPAGSLLVRYSVWHVTIDGCLYLVLNRSCFSATCFLAVPRTATFRLLDGLPAFYEVRRCGSSKE